MGFLMGRSFFFWISDRSWMPAVKRLKWPTMALVRAKVCLIPSAPVYDLTKSSRVWLAQKPLLKPAHPLAMFDALSDTLPSTA